MGGFGWIRVGLRVSAMGCVGSAVLLLMLAASRGPQAEDASKTVDEPRVLSRRANGVERRAMTVAGREREYLIHVPKRAAADDPGRLPILIYLHGGGGRANLAPSRSGPPWISIAPEAIDRAWNVADIPHRKPGPRDPTIDDVAFVSALIDLAIEEGGDPRRVTVSGVSRGGMMTLQLLSELNDKIHSGVVAIASLPALLRDDYRLDKPTHVLIMNGTKDPLIGYDGGFGSFLRIRRPEDKKYDMLPTEELARDLAVMQGLVPEPEITPLPDTKDDGCRAEVHKWVGRPEQGSVTLVKVIGGGHTIPGLPQTVPEALVGPTCQDFNGFAFIGEFLESVPPREE